MFTIGIVSEVVCPWCFIGTRRLTACAAECGYGGPAILAAGIRKALAD